MMRLLRNAGLLVLAMFPLALLLLGFLLGLAGKALSFVAMRGFDAIVLVFQEPPDGSARS